MEKNHCPEQRWSRALTSLTILNGTNDYRLISRPGYLDYMCSPEIVVETLQRAFEDNDVAEHRGQRRRRRGLAHDAYSPIDELVREHWPSIANASNIPFRRRGKRQRSDYYTIFVCPDHRHSSRHLRLGTQVEVLRASDRRAWRLRPAANDDQGLVDNPVVGWRGADDRGRFPVTGWSQWSLRWCATGASARRGGDNVPHAVPGSITTGYTASGEGVPAHTIAAPAPTPSSRISPP